MMRNVLNLAMFGRELVLSHLMVTIFFSKKQVHFSYQKKVNMLTHDTADDRGLLGDENVLTVALVQYTCWTEYVNEGQMLRDSTKKVILLLLCINDCAVTQ